jgi:hypothetical protein
VDARSDTREASHRPSHSPVDRPGSGPAAGDPSASSAAAAAARVANPPRRTRRRCPAADGRSALKYHDPCSGELRPGQHALSSVPVASSRHPHRRYTEP